ncbi:MAG: N-acetyl sugar amidotransferase, partial [Rectinema sp.]
EVALAYLEQLAATIRSDGRQKKYDCVIGVSGGVDSTMVAYTVKKLGLRPLAVHLDNGWDAELAVSNIEKTLNKLGIDLLTHVIDWEEFRDLQLSFFKASVANVEVLTDHAIMAILFKTAARNSIKYVISGGNVVTEAIMPQSWMYDSRDLRHIAAIHEKYGSVPLRTLPHCSLLEYFYYIFIRRIKYVPVLNYISYKKDDAKKLIEKELDWRDYGGKHYESIFTRFFQAYYLPEKFKIDKRRAHLSTLLCSGQITRDDAMKEMERPAYSPELFQQDLEFFIKKMKLSREEWDCIMALPVRTYKDYPSNRFIFRINPWIIRWIKYIVKP